MVAWIHALHVQIGLCSENHRLYEAEIWITEDVSTCESLDGNLHTLTTELSNRL